MTRGGQPSGEELESLRRRIVEQQAQSTQKERQLERYAADLRETFKQERARSLELRQSYMATVRALSNAVEARDAYTGGHAERVAAYALEISRATGNQLASDSEIEFGFLLHDIGKVAVPDAILFKPEPLTAEERLLMERHPVVGWQILRHIDFLGPAKEVVRHHHERWDGKGYPDGLAGEEIPFAARVFAVADSLDALTTTRPYRRAQPFIRAREVILGARGTQFDPAVVDAFATLDLEFLRSIQLEVSGEPAEADPAAWPEP
jgi:HD-GYP domain-containing protein (c-di-GMP phosphodiesterase class II)